MEHISYRDTTKLYESISTDTAVLVWSNAAHEGTLKGLRQTVVHGVSMYDRLQSELCLEMRLCALYFNQRITKKELLGEMRHLITDDFAFESFQMALRRMRNEKVSFKLVSTFSQLNLGSSIGQNNNISLAIFFPFRQIHCSCSSLKYKPTRV